MGAVLLFISSLLFGAAAVGLISVLNAEGGWAERGDIVAIVTVVTFGVGCVAAVLLARGQSYPFDGASSRGIGVLAVAFAALSLFMFLGTLAPDPDVLLLPLGGLALVGFGGSLVGSVIIGLAWLVRGDARRFIACVFMVAIALAVLGGSSPASAGVAVVVGTGSWLAAAVLAIRHSTGLTEP